MAFSENPVTQTFIGSTNVTALSYTSTDGATITYSSGGIPYGSVVKHDTVSANMGDVILTAGADKCLGIALVAPAAAAGQAIPVCVGGVCKAIAGGAVAMGDTLMANASGQVVTATAATANFMVGRALQAATAAGDLIAIEVNPSDGKVTMP